MFRIFKKKKPLILSADQARKKFEDHQKSMKNERLKAVFKEIHYSISQGKSEFISGDDMTIDGLGIYLEGLGYEVNTVWSDGFGRVFDKEPEVADLVQNGYYRRSRIKW